MKVMETKRLIFRTLEMSDLDEMMLIWGDQEVMKYCGNGYATEAARACVNYATTSTSINLLGASIEPENTSSERVLVKLGFQKTEDLLDDLTGQKLLYYIKETN